MKKANKKTEQTFRSYKLETILKHMDADEKKVWDLFLPYACEIADGVVLKMIRAGIPFDSTMPL